MVRVNLHSKNRTKVAFIYSQNCRVFTQTLALFPSRHGGTATLKLTELDGLTAVEKLAQDLTVLILNRFHLDSNFNTLYLPSGTHLISCMANLY